MWDVAHTADQSQVKKYVLYLPPSPIPAGDSVQNILGDVLSCALGYILGTLFLALDLWWLSLVWVAVSEVTFHEISLAALVTIDPLIHWSGGVPGLHAGQLGDGAGRGPGPLRPAQVVAGGQAVLYCTVLYCTVLY